MLSLTKPTKGVIVAAAALAGAYLTRHAIDWLRREPPVSPQLAERPWVAQTLGTEGILFDSPWPLKPLSLTFPPETARAISSSTALSQEGDGMHLMVMHASFRPGTAGSLEGAAENSIANMRSVPGTSSVNGGKRPTTVLGLPGFDVEARIERERGGPLQLYGVVFGEGLELYQVQFIANADQPAAKAAWKRLRASIHRR